MDQLKPETPDEVGVESRTPELAQLEPAHILANDARDRLEPTGFSYSQILDWAETFVAEDGATADVESFIRWIERKER